MSDIAISIENISKTYRLGVIGNGTLREDLQSWWARVRGRPDPNSVLGTHHAAIEGQTLWALQNVSLDVKQGEVLGIIGRNGAGKSTLLKILSRVTAPTSGKIKVKGRVASLLEVGTGFHPELTGRENIFLNGAILGMTKAEIRQKLDEIIAFSEIEQFIDTPVKRYSSGMYVRLAFSVAAHLEPEILVVDEVLAVGDAAFQKKCLGKMGDVAREGRTVLFVSHNMGAVRNLCQNGVVLKNGEVVFSGETHSAVDFYMQGDADKASGRIVITDRDRAPGASREVEFVAVEMPGVIRGDVLASNQPIEFRLHIKGNRPVDECRVNATVSTLDDVPIGSVSSTVTFSVQKLEERCVSFILKNHRLAIGKYKISFSLGTGNFSTRQRDFDVLPGILQFQIELFDMQNKTGFSEWQPAWGSLAFEADVAVCDAIRPPEEEAQRA